jgi:HEAT repeat protein
VVAAAREAHRGDVLLVVDQAETRPALADLLRVIAHDGGDGRLRVLLTARARGEWWERLGESPGDGVRALVDDAGAVQVGALTGAGLDGDALIRAAVPAFAQALGVVPPEVASVRIPAGATVPLLVLQATALLIVLDARDQQEAGRLTEVVADETVLMRVLSREASFWQASAERAGVRAGGGLATLRQAVAVACLFTPADEADAIRLVRCVAGLADADDEAVLSVARWLQRLYPPEQGLEAGPSARWWGAPQPGLLAESHAVAELVGSPAFARACLRDLSAAQGTGVLTVLAHACVHQPQARVLLDEAIRNDLPGLGVPAVNVAIQTPGPVASILAGAASTSNAPLEALTRIAEAISYPTTVLAEAAVALTTRINVMLPASTSKRDLAQWRGLHATRLSAVGRPVDALPAAREAVGICRELAAASPAQYRPDLARSLMNLCVPLWELAPADALTPAEEAVGIYRELAAASPAQYRPDLAASLISFVGTLFAVGRPGAALSPAREAVGICRELAAASPAQHSVLLAVSGHNLGLVLQQLRLPPEVPPSPRAAVTVDWESPAASAGDVTVSPSTGVPAGVAGQGVQVGDGNVQFNTFEAAGPEVVPASPDEFRADLLLLVERVDEDVVRRGLPEQLVPGGNVLRMARTVRLLGGVRQPSGAEPSKGHSGQAYALAGEGHGRGGVGSRRWDQVAAEHDRLVVLGDPGTGKSWLLRGEAHRLAGAAWQVLTGPADASGAMPLVPVMIRAGVLAALEGPTLADAVSGHLVAERWLPSRSQGRLRELIEDGGIVLLVDALDEVPARGSGLGSLERVTGLLRRWAESCTGTARCVVTSRLAGYVGAPVPAAAEAELLPFTPQDARRAADAWDLPAEAAARLREWLQLPAVEAMARVPLLLALLCSLATRPGQAPPRSRAELYKAVVWQYLSRAHRSGGPGGTAGGAGEGERHELLAALTRIAFTYADNDEGWVDQMPYRELLEALRGIGEILGESPAAVLDRLVTQAGLLVPAGSPAVDEQDYLFLHRTFAEYLLARHLAQVTDEERARIVAAHQWFDPDWAEVIPMLGSFLASNPKTVSQARTMVSRFLHASPDPFHRAFGTALRIICEAPDPDRLLTPDTSLKLRDGLPRLLRNKSSTNRLVRILIAAPTWPQAITSAILALCESDDAGHRQVAAQVLIGRNGDEVTRALLALTADTDRLVRQTVARVLAGREGTAITRALLDLAADTDDFVSQGAVKALANRDGAEVTRAIITRTTDTDLSARWAAVEVLGRRPDAEATRALLALAVDPDVREQAMEALSGREGAEATRALVTLATDRHAGTAVRQAAIQALAGVKGAESTSALITFTTDTAPFVRAAAARALARRQRPEATRALIDLITDTKISVRRTAMQVLAARDGADVTRALLAVATDANADSATRQAAIEATARREGAEATRALSTLATDRHAGAAVRQAAMQALSGRSGADDAVALLALAADPNPALRRKAARELASREAPALFRGLIALAADTDTEVRQVVADALMGRYGAEATGALLALAADPDPLVRRTAVVGLWGRKETEVTRALITRAADTDPSVRVVVPDGLKQREGDDTTRALLVLAADVDPGVREVATRALADREGDEVTDALHTLAADAEPGVREAAARALADREKAQDTAALLALAVETEADPAAREAAVWALADREGIDITRALIATATATGTNSSLRQVVAKVLAGREGAEATRVLITLATDATTESVVRDTAVEGLAGREGADATRVLITLATEVDADVGLRQTAVDGLARREGHESTRALIAVATEVDVDGETRLVAVEGLAGRQGSEVIRALVELTADADVVVRETAVEMLAARERDEAPQAAVTVHANEHDTDTLRGPAVVVAQEGPEATRALLALLTDTDALKRQPVAEALVMRRDPYILEWLCEKSRINEPLAVQRQFRDLAEKVVDRLYVHLPAESKQEVLRGLERLTHVHGENTSVGFTMVISGEARRSWNIKFPSWTRRRHH